MTKKEIPMDTGNVLDLFRDRIASMSGGDIEFHYNTYFANPGEQLIFVNNENFVLEVPTDE
jgi:hypothetical protein